MEIENKYLLIRPPAELSRFPHNELRQGYLAVGGGTTVRLRLQGTWI